MSDHGNGAGSMTSDEHLARLIVDELLEQSIIRPSDASRVLEKLASGQATADDWTLWIENALDHPGKGVTDGTV